MFSVHGVDLADFFLLAETRHLAFLTLFRRWGWGEGCIFLFALLMATKDLDRFGQLLRIPGYGMRKGWRVVFPCTCAHVAVWLPSTFHKPQSRIVVLFSLAFSL